MNSNVASTTSVGGRAVGKRGSRAVRKVRVPKTQLAEFTAQLSIMSRSGVDLATALASLASQCQRPQFAAVLQEVHQAIVSGNTLSDALRKFPTIFDGAFIAAVAAGEASGKMPVVLSHLAELHRGEVRLNRTIKSMLTYPILLTAVASSVVACLVVFVLPRFASIFEQYDMTLPVLTQLLLNFSAELRARWWLWLPAVGGAGALLVTWNATESGRSWRDSFCVQAPVLRGVFQPLYTGRICRLIGLMLSSGVPLVEGLQLTLHSVSNRPFKKLLSELREAVVNGRSMSSVLAKTTLFPQSAREMLATAEGTGKLGEVTKLLGDYYEEEAESRLRQLLRMFEPAITVVMGVVVAGIVMAVMLPIFDLSSMAGGRH